MVFSKIGRRTNVRVGIGIESNTAMRMDQTKRMRATGETPPLTDGLGDAKRVIIRGDATIKND
jgi:hypothetical protein